MVSLKLDCGLSVRVGGKASPSALSRFQTLTSNPEILTLIGQFYHVYISIATVVIVGLFLGCRFAGLPVLQFPLGFQILASCFDEMLVLPSGFDNMHLVSIRS